MINKIKFRNNISTSVLMVSIFVLSVFMTSCEFELPEANSIPDATPPAAAFGESIDGDYLSFAFANFSISATDYVWNFGDGTTSTEYEPKHTYAEAATDEEGTTYTVSLTASDKLGATSTFSKEIVVLKPAKPIAIVPTILNPSFDIPGDDGKYLQPWVPASSAIGKLPQLSSSSSFVGGKAGKFPGVDDLRVGYQTGIAVSKNTSYKISYMYSIETGDPSELTVSILAGTISDASEVAGATIASHAGTVQVGKTPFEKVDIIFNSGDNDLISIHITSTKGNETAYIEEFTAEVNE